MIFACIRILWTLPNLWELAQKDPLISLYKTGCSIIHSSDLLESYEWQSLLLTDGQLYKWLSADGLFLSTSDPVHIFPPLSLGWKLFSPNGKMGFWKL